MHTGSATFRPDIPSRRGMLAAMAGAVLTSPPVRRTAAGSTSPGASAQGFCPNPGGRDLLISPHIAALAECGDCKWKSMVACREAIDAGAQRVELCMTVTDDPEEHVFTRIDGRVRDHAWEDGMPVRVVREFIALQVWPIAAPASV